MVKIFFYILIFILIGLSSMGQKLLLNNMTTFDDKRLHFGFSLGINMVDLNFEHYQTMDDNPNFKPSSKSDDFEYWGKAKSVRADISSLTPGFTVGIVSNLRLSGSFDLRFLPGMSFSERKLVYNIPIKDLNNITTGSTDYYSIKSTFLDFPLLLKYKSKRMNNQRPYLIAGGAYRVDISKTGKDDLVRLNQFSSSLEAGIGWDTYLQFFRLSTELKFSFGMDNVLGSAPAENNKVYSNAFSRLTTDMFILSFHFE